ADRLRGARARRRRHADPGAVRRGRRRRRGLLPRVRGRDRGGADVRAPRGPHRSGRTRRVIRYAHAAGVATIMLDRPEKLNALDEQAYDDLRDAFVRADAQAEARVVVLKGEGRAFCGGGDVDMARARRVPADEAARIGLVNRTVPAGELDVAVAELCEELIGLSGEGLRLTKAGLRATKQLLLASMAAAAEQNVSVFSRGELHAAFD